jgi:hypothetical protein
MDSDKVKYRLHAIAVKVTELVSFALLILRER